MMIIMIGQGQTQNHGNPVVAHLHDELLALARRIILRANRGRLDIVVELIVRELRTNHPARAFLLAYLLAQEAADAGAETRMEAVDRGVAWIPVLHDPATGAAVTPDSPVVGPTATAVRMIAAMHRHATGSAEAATELHKAYQAAVDDGRQHHLHLYAELVRYAVLTQHGRVEVTYDEA